VSSLRLVTFTIGLKEATKGTFVLRAIHEKRGVTEQATWTSSNPEVLVLDPARPGVVGAGVRGGGVVTARFGEHEASWSIDVWDGVLTHLEPPVADSPPRLVAGIECRLRVPIDSWPTNSYDGHELVVTAEPPDVAQIVGTHPQLRLRALQPGRVTLRARYGHAVSERTYDVREEALVLRPIRVQDSNLDPHRIWLGERFEASAELTNLDGRFIFEAPNVRWSSTDPRVLGVEADPICAMLTGLAEGRAQVVAEWRTARQTTNVVVCERPKIEWF
jgi:hypothetical protein